MFSYLCAHCLCSGGPTPNRGFGRSLYAANRWGNTVGLVHGGVRGWSACLRWIADKRDIGNANVDVFIAKSCWVATSNLLRLVMKIRRYG